MLKFIFITTILFCFLNTQGQNTSEQFSEFFEDIECFSNIVKQGLENQSWKLDNLNSNSDSCEFYLSKRQFELQNDTLIITKTEKTESSNLKEIKLTIENDSLVIVTLVPKEKIYLKGKSRKKLSETEKQKQSGDLLLKFIYKGNKIKFSFL